MNVLHILIEIAFIYCESEAMRKLSKVAVAVYNVVRNGNNVKTGLSEEINRLSKFYRTV
jgi:hypothetical protein